MENVDTGEYLQNHGINKDSLSLIDSEKVTSTEAYLIERGVAEKAIIEAAIGREDRKLKHFINARVVILYPLAISMSIIPVWLMLLLSLPAFDKNPYSERMQLAFLSAVAGGFVGGLYLVITRDLFPSGNLSSKSKKEGSEDPE